MQKYYVPLAALKIHMLIGATKDSQLGAKELFSTEGLVVVVTGGGTGQLSIQVEKKITLDKLQALV